MLEWEVIDITKVPEGGLLETQRTPYEGGWLVRIISRDQYGDLRPDWGVALTFVPAKSG